MTKKWSDEVDTDAVGTKKRHGEKRKANKERRKKKKKRKKKEKKEKKRKKDSHKIRSKRHEPATTQLLVMICNVVQSCLKRRASVWDHEVLRIWPGAGRQGEMLLASVDVFEVFIFLPIVMGA